MSGAQPWMKFYPTDWQADQALRLCSLAARGLWVECMCIMHRATPYGHLLVNGRPVTDTQLAVLVGTSPAQVPELLGELEAAGVFSRTGQGVIYSRRMTRDDKKARVAKKNGKNGGNPTLSKQREIQPSDKGRDKGGDNTQKPEAREEHTKEAVASLGADGADKPEMTDRELVWGNGLAWLKRETGLSDRKARELVGKWCKGGAEALVIDTMRDCRAATPAVLDPIPWIEASLSKRRKDRDQHTQQHRPSPAAKPSRSNLLAGVLDGMGPDLARH